MTLWVLKGGSNGERESRIIEKSILGIGWEELGDLSDFKDKEKLSKLYEQKYPDSTKMKKAVQVGQLLAFIKTAKIGDLVVVPLKTSSSIAIGKIMGDYEYRTDLGSDMVHTRPVEWINTDIPRTKFDQDILYTFGAFLTFCKAERNNAEERVKKIVFSKVKIEKKELPEETETIDIEQISKDEIMKYIEQKFKGHDFAILVDAIFKAQGFLTQKSNPGPDGGIDIIASHGSFGFSEPRVCVQVKSSSSPIDVNVYRELKGVMQSVNANHGLLVSWGGFKSSLKREAKNDFLQIKLWDSGDVIEEIFRNYNKLNAEIRAKLPLKKIWTLSSETTE